MAAILNSNARHAQALRQILLVPLAGLDDAHRGGRPFLGELFLELRCLLRVRGRLELIFARLLHHLFLLQDLHQFEVELPTKLVDFLLGIEGAHLLNFGYLLLHSVLLLPGLLAAEILLAAIQVRRLLPRMQGHGFGRPRTIQAFVSRAIWLVDVDSDAEFGHDFRIHLALDLHFFEGLHNLLLLSFGFLLHQLPLDNHLGLVFLDGAKHFICLFNLTPKLVSLGLLATILPLDETLLFVALSVI